MASTYSTSLRLELMATGDQSGTWGTTTNTNLGTLLEQAITGVLSVAQGDVANLTLTANNGATDQARNMVVILTGAMSADRNVVVPTVNKVYLVKNSTTGGFSVIVKTAAGTGVTIANGTAQWVYCDGTNVIQGQSGTLAPQTPGAVAITGGSVTGLTTLSSTGSAVGFTGLTSTSTETAAAAGPIIDLYRDSASPAANDIMGQVLFDGRDSAANKQEYAAIEAVIVSPTSTAESSRLDFYTQSGGARTNGLSLAGATAASANFVAGYTAAATAAGTTTLTALSNQQLFLTGTTTQTVVLPVTSTLGTGRTYLIRNSSAGIVTVNSSGGNLVQTMAQNSYAILTVILASGTTAASWAVAYYPAIAGLAKLASGTLSAAATLDIPLTAYTGYSGFRFNLTLIPSVDSSGALMRFSADGGATYDAGAADYMYTQTVSSAASSGETGSNAASSLSVASPDIGNGSSEGAEIIIDILHPENAAVKTKALYRTTMYRSNDIAYSNVGGGLRNAAQVCNAVRFLMTSGTIASGYYEVYGYV